MIYIGYVDLSLCTCAVSIFLSSCFIAYQLNGVAVLYSANFAILQSPVEISISFRISSDFANSPLICCFGNLTWASDHFEGRSNSRPHCSCQLWPWVQPEHLRPGCPKLRQLRLVFDTDVRRRMGSWLGKGRSGKILGCKSQIEHVLSSPVVLFPRSPRPLPWSRWRRWSRPCWCARTGSPPCQGK